MNYWDECIKEAFEEIGIVATESQITEVVDWVEGAHENYGMAFGHDCIANPLEQEIRELKFQHKKDLVECEGREQQYRKSVARRRGCKPENVWLENGEVHYEY